VSLAGEYIFEIERAVNALDDRRARFCFAMRARRQRSARRSCDENTLARDRCDSGSRNVPVAANARSKRRLAIDEDDVATAAR